MFAMWGVVNRITHDGSTTFSFAWQEAIDSSGWLYGALIIAIQSAVKSWPRVESSPGVGIGCIVVGAVCLLLLLAAMDQRGRNAAWRPPRSMKITSFSIVIMLVIMVLLLGYSAQPAVPADATLGQTTNVTHAAQGRFESEK